MSINDILGSLAPYQFFIIVYFIGLPIIAFAFGKIAGEKSGESPYKYVYSVFVYMTSVPGMFSLVLTAYALFIMKADLLKVNAALYFLPIISTAATIAVVKKDVDLDLVPGFDRLYGLFIVLGITFAFVLAILQTRIFLFFGGSIMMLVAVAAALFATLQLGAAKLLGEKVEKEESDDPAKRIDDLLSGKLFESAEKKEKPSDK